MKAQKCASLMTDLLVFTKEMFKARKGFDLKPNWHQKAICNALEKVVIGQTSRLIINIPPRAGKTELAVINFIAWCMGNWPSSEFIHASYSKRLATNNTYNIRALMQHETYQYLFPHVQIKEDSAAKDEFRTIQGGVVYATGTDGTITGYGAGGMTGKFNGAIIIDDPMKAGEAMSETIRRNNIEWFSNTLESRKNSSNTPIIVIMQRLHEEDLSGWLLNNGNGEKWEHLCIPAETDEGESFWKEQFPIEDLQRKHAANPYVYAGQYLQRPAPKDSGMFSRHWFEIVEAAPAKAKRVRYWDRAATVPKHGTDPDYTVGLRMAKDDDGILYIEDIVRLRDSALMVQKAIQNTAKADGVLCKIGLEQDPGQAGKGEVEHIIRQLQGYNVSAIRVTKDKTARATPVSAQAQAGNVKLVRGPWNDTFLKEVELFPFGKHDDQVDCLSGAGQMLFQTGIDYANLTRL